MKRGRKRRYAKHRRKWRKRGPGALERMYVRLDRRRDALEADALRVMAEGSNRALDDTPIGPRTRKA